MENGIRTEFLEERTPVAGDFVWLRLYVEERECWFEWSGDGEAYQKIGPKFDTSLFSDEYCKYGEFTGTMVGLTCADRVRHSHYADFDFFELFNISMLVLVLRGNFWYTISRKQ